MFFHSEVSGDYSDLGFGVQIVTATIGSAVLHPVLRFN